MLQHSFIVGGFTVIQQIIASAQQNVLFFDQPHSSNQLLLLGARITLQQSNIAMDSWQWTINHL
jgi:hypothetical protein